MDEAQNLADRVAVIVDGRIVAEGHPDTLGTRRTASCVVAFRVPAGTEGMPDPFVADESGSVSVAVEDAVSALHDLTSWAMHERVVVEGLSVSRSSLEDAYLELTGSPDGE
jgi:ABC-2 type transport system ATP-binding protein